MKTKTISADEIAEMADKGLDVTKYMGIATKGFNPKKEKTELSRTTLDFGVNLFQEIDVIADELNISRQALIKTTMQEYVMRWKEAKKFAMKKTAP